MHINQLRNIIFIVYLHCSEILALKLDIRNCDSELTKIALNIWDVRISLTHVTFTLGSRWNFACKVLEMLSP